MFIGRSNNMRSLLVYCFAIDVTLSRILSFTLPLNKFFFFEDAKNFCPQIRNTTHGIRGTEEGFKAALRSPLMLLNLRGISSEHYDYFSLKAEPSYCKNTLRKYKIE